MNKILGVILASFIGSAAAGAAVPVYAAGNDITAEKYVAAFADNYTGYYYKNLTNEDKFVAALEDDYTSERYGSIMDNSRFAALLDEKSADQAASANDVPRHCAAGKNVDFLSNNIVLARLTEGCY